jgi:Protein of unknown function (DUF3619)
VKTKPTPPLTAAQREALEARFALRVSARLEEGAQALPHDISERLRVAREQAMRAGREARLAASPVAAPAQVVVSTAGLATAGASGNAAPQVDVSWSESRYARAPGHGRRLDDKTSWGWRIASALPLLALAFGLWGIRQYYKHEQVQAATEIDMQLLTDDLPPNAYADPGFTEFMRTETGPTVRSIEDAPPEVDGDLQTTDTEPAESTP